MLRPRARQAAALLGQLRQAWRGHSACPAPQPLEGEVAEAAARAERLLSSRTASTSGSGPGPRADQGQARDSRWLEMQEALGSARQPGGSARRPLPSLAESRQALRGRPVTQPQPADSVLDWREVAVAAEAALSPEQLQAGALTDSFGRRHSYLRISLTERCNLRCQYCMPEEGVALTPGPQLLTSDEILRLARLFVGAGVTKVRLTGGEPTLRPDIVDLTRELAQLPGLQAVGITSNGIALRRKLPALKEAGLSLLNLSLDTLRPERFLAMTRRPGLQRVLQTVEQAVALGFDPVKLNVVVMRGANEDEIPDFVELTRSQPINVRFIEYMPFDGNVWAHRKMVPFREMAAAVAARFPAGLQRLDDPAGEVAKNFRVPGFRGSVSFITSMTKAFCADCTRLRLMADGNLKVCLFGAGEVSLRDAMREGASDAQLLAIVSAAVDRKRAAHAGMFELARSRNRPMVAIGG